MRHLLAAVGLCVATATVALPAAADDDAQSLFIADPGSHSSACADMTNFQTVINVKGSGWFGIAADRTYVDAAAAAKACQNKVHGQAMRWPTIVRVSACAYLEDNYASLAIVPAMKAQASKACSVPGDPFGPSSSK